MYTSAIFVRYHCLNLSCQCIVKAEIDSPLCLSFHLFLLIYFKCTIFSGKSHVLSMICCTRDILHIYSRPRQPSRVQNTVQAGNTEYTVSHGDFGSRGSLFLPRCPPHLSLPVTAVHFHTYTSPCLRAESLSPARRFSAVPSAETPTRFHSSRRTAPQEDLMANV